MLLQISAPRQQIVQNCMQRSAPHTATCGNARFPPTSKRDSAASSLKHGRAEPGTWCGTPPEAWHGPLEASPASAPGQDSACATPPQELSTSQHHAPHLTEALMLDQAAANLSTQTRPQAGQCRSTGSWHFTGLKRDFAPARTSAQRRCGRHEGPPAPLSGHLFKHSGLTEGLSA